MVNVIGLKKKSPPKSAVWRERDFWRDTIKTLPLMCHLTSLADILWMVH